jgi:hypothetical protein
MKLNKRRIEVLECLKNQDIVKVEDLILRLEKSTNYGLVRFSRLDELCWFKKDFLRYMKRRMISEDLCSEPYDKCFLISKKGLMCLENKDSLYRLEVQV